MAFVLDEEMQNVTNIKVIGVGGGGGNAVNRMVESGLSGVEFVAMNTDQQALLNSKATQKVQLGAKLTKGRGAGADPEIGQRAAEESKDEITNALKGAQMVFITAGMGGGTGTGAAPVVAETAHDLGILTVGIVTKPFAFEGKRKMAQAEQGIASLMMHVDSLIVIPNERLKLISQEKITLMNAFEAADNALLMSISTISEAPLFSIASVYAIVDPTLPAPMIVILALMLSSLNWAAISFLFLHRIDPRPVKCHFFINHVIYLTSQSVICQV